VRRVAKKLNFKEVGEDEDWILYWTDLSVSIERVNQMKRWQVGIVDFQESNQGKL
jgi:tubulin polyglutamylase TTLL6/13